MAHFIEVPCLGRGPKSSGFNITYAGGMASINLDSIETASTAYGQIHIYTTLVSATGIRVPCQPGAEVADLFLLALRMQPLWSDIAIVHAETTSFLVRRSCVATVAYEPHEITIKYKNGIEDALTGSDLLGGYAKIKCWLNEPTTDTKLEYPERASTHILALSVDGKSAQLQPSSLEWSIRG